jgi:NAD(P)H-flavin reductase
MHLLDVEPQIINAVLKNPEDRTQIALLYANQTSEDILLRQQLEALAAKHDNFRVWHTSEGPSPSRANSLSGTPASAGCVQ